MNADYTAGTEVLEHLQVVNDSAERGVALIEEYNQILTKKENQKQFLSQVVQEHRRRFPNFNKGTLSACGVRLMQHCEVETAHGSTVRLLY